MNVSPVPVKGKGTAELQDSTDRKKDKAGATILFLRTSMVRLRVNLKLKSELQATITKAVFIKDKMKRKKNSKKKKMPAHAY